MITDTILRDAHQSHAATRMRFDEMEEVLPLLDEIGYYSLEAWGGATFDSCLRFFKRGPLGSIEKSEKILKKDAHTDAFKGAEFTGLQTLRR